VPRTQLHVQPNQLPRLHHDLTSNPVFVMSTNEINIEAVNERTRNQPNYLKRKSKADLAIDSLNRIEKDLNKLLGDIKTTKSQLKRTK